MSILNLFHENARGIRDLNKRKIHFLVAAKAKSRHSFLARKRIARVM